MFNILSVVFAVMGLVLTSYSFFDHWDDIQDEAISKYYAVIGGEKDEMLSNPTVKRYLNSIKLERWGTICIGVSILLQAFR